jgi:hypothetical protein
MMGAASVLTAVLAQRLIVLIAVLGGIALTWLGLEDPNAYKIGSLAVYVLGVVLPAVWLAGR